MSEILKTTLLGLFFGTFGTTIGGIIGRLEHTGNVKGCIVKGNNLKINAKSTEKEIYAGGIVGIDMGPNHKNLISIENCSFIGNNNFTIEWFFRNLFD